MKILGMLAAVLVLAIIGGVVYLGVAHVNVDQTTVTKTITPPTNS